MRGGRDQPVHSPTSANLHAIGRLLGLRIDVDTYRGACNNLPALLDMLEERALSCSVFVPGGPDRTAFAVQRIFTQKGYLRKLIRTGAFSIYGPAALASMIAHRHRRICQAAGPMHRVLAGGHELAAHGYIHTLWHNSLHSMKPGEVVQQVRLAVRAVEESLGTRPAGFGGPGWQANFASLHALDSLGLEYGSDTRGRHPFIPCLHGYVFSTPQVPTTLPSLDEFPGGLPPMKSDIAKLRNEIKAQAWPVYTAHAELEGQRYRKFFSELLSFIEGEGISVVPLSRVLSAFRACATLEVFEVLQGSVPGRPGLVAMQGYRPQDRSSRITDGSHLSGRHRCP